MKAIKHLTLEEQEAKRERRRKRSNIISPLLYILLSFLVIIMTGFALLATPWASSDPKQGLAPIDALFVSVSAVCVTGLSPVVLAESLSLFGKIIVGIEIQIGGLGILTIAASVVFITGRKININQAIVMKEALSQSGFGHMKKLIYHILIITFVFEAIGTALSYLVFRNDFAPAEAFGISLFHAVSAFNNAGFDIIGNTSLIAYKDNVLLNLVTCALIIAGGLGFLVFEDIINYRKFRKFPTQTKIVLIMTAIILVISTLLNYLIGHDKMTFLQSFFYSVNLRTAGFTTFDNVNTLSRAGVIASIFFMFIGGSPVSTAGGIKTTTFFVILLSFHSFVHGKKAVAFKREISAFTRNKAFMVAFLFLALILVGSTAISLFENNAYPLEFLMYEATSALCTVGFTMGITPLLSVGSKLILCLLMFTGRVGPIMMLTSWNPNLYHVKKSDVDYLEADVMIG